MAANARARSRDSSRRFWSVLCHCLSECFLIVMLLVIAVVSYTATRFARICRIRSPCMLCSRLDKVLHGKSWFSEELICAAHRLEIVRLSHCQIHNKLAHSDDLCEKCFLSCSGLVGKTDNLTNMSAKEKVNSRSRHTQLCSCCSEPFKKRRNAQRISEELSGRSPNDRMRKVKQRNISMVTVGDSSDEDFELPCGGYRKLNARSDSESKIHVSDDDDDGATIPSKARNRTRDTSCDDAQLQPMITSTNTLSTSPFETTIPKKSINTIPLVPLNTAMDNSAKSSDHTLRHGLEEINWSQVNVSNNNLDMHLMAGSEQVCEELPKEKTFLVGIEEVGDSEGVSGSPDVEETKFFAASANDETSSIAHAHINRNNSRGNLRSPRWSEVISAKETNSRTQEEVKTFMSQLSSACGFDGPWSEVAASPRTSIQIDDYTHSDATGSRHFLDLEPDIHGTSEDEGEISLESLKQQCDLNKKRLTVLYTELDAERSASAVAASEAMAMINRLQVEKAAMHMEALQYLRMMEEQADHDQKEIEKLNDLLTEREKQMLDLEAELENCENRFRGESFDLGKFDATDGDMAFGVLDSSDFVRNTFFDFEDEKAKILESLRSLEETLGMPSTNRFNLGGANDDLPNESLSDHPIDLLGQYVENPESECRSSLMPGGHLNNKSVSCQRNDESQSVENQKYFGSGSPPHDDNISSMTGIKQEISLLNSRFMALEADQKFIKQILSSLKCSNDGEQYMQEITTHLRELRRTATEQR